MRAPAARSPAPQPAGRAPAPEPAAKSTHGGILNLRPEAVAQQKLAEFVRTSPRVVAQAKREADLRAAPEQEQTGIDNPPPEAVAQRKLADFIRTSPRVVAQAKRETALRGVTVQRTGPEEEEVLQGKFAPVQGKGTESDREPHENKTGLPDNLKAGIESLSGMSLDNVKVHYNSAPSPRNSTPSPTRRAATSTSRRGRNSICPTKPGTSFSRRRGG